MIEIERVYITGRPQDSYLASVAMEIKAGPHKFYFGGMRIIMLKGKRELVMPSRRTPGGWKTTMHPLNEETREVLQKAALLEYDRRRGSAVTG